VIGEFPQPPECAGNDIRNRSKFLFDGRIEPGPPLALCRVSIDVFRAAVLSIVLTLVVGPNASLLCAVWCHPEAATVAHCEHQNPSGSPSVAEKDSCPDIAAGATAFVREDVRRGVSASDGQHAVVVPPFRFVPPPNPSELGRELRQHAPLEARPLVFALRI
jgi:hypothetical protein